jgi:hypothetical protein
MKKIKQIEILTNFNHKAFCIPTPLRIMDALERKKMQKKVNVFLVLCLVVFGFLFQGCDNLPTEPENDDGEICESYYYDVEFIYERVKNVTIYWAPNSGTHVTMSTSWQEFKNSYHDMEKVGENRYKVFIKNVPVNRPRRLARYKADMAILVWDGSVWVGEKDPHMYSCTVTEDVYARVPGKTGKVKLIHKQEAKLCTTAHSEQEKEILINLYCDGRIN